MKKINFIIIIILLITVLVFSTVKLGMTSVKSSINGKKYSVQNTKLKYDSSDTLAKLHIMIIKFSNYLYKNKRKYKEYEQYINQLNNNIIDTIISENTRYSNYTSYSVNKGEEIVFCLKSKKDGSIHHMNLLTYVALHELAHIACPEQGHTPLFNKIFRFFIKIGVEMKIYKKINFSIKPVEYCGMIIANHI